MPIPGKLSACSRPQARKAKRTREFKVLTHRKPAHQPHGTPNGQGCFAGVGSQAHFGIGVRETMVRTARSLSSGTLHKVTVIKNQPEDPQKPSQKLKAGQGLLRIHPPVLPPDSGSAMTLPVSF